MRTFSKNHLVVDLSWIFKPQPSCDSAMFQGHKCKTTNYFFKKKQTTNKGYNAQRILQLF